MVLSYQILSGPVGTSYQRESKTIVGKFFVINKYGNYGIEVHNKVETKKFGHLSPQDGS